MTRTPTKTGLQALENAEKMLRFGAEGRADSRAINLQALLSEAVQTSSTCGKDGSSCCQCELVVTFAATVLGGLELG